MRRRLASSFLSVVAISVCVDALNLQAQTTRTYYVSPGGNDSNAGSESQPFRTIQHAATLVNPGDTVIAEDGIYTGIGSGCGSASRAMVCLTRGGSSGIYVNGSSQGSAIPGAHTTLIANTATSDVGAYEFSGALPPSAPTGFKRVQ